MATRRMRIKATINVPRGGIKTEVTTPSSSSSQQEPVSSPAPPPQQFGTEVTPLSPVSPVAEPVVAQERPPSPQLLLSPTKRACTPPPSSSSSPKSPPSWPIQRPSPSKSPAGLPPSGSILRRSPSPALSRLCGSPGPPQSPSSPVKLPPSNLSPVKLLGLNPVVLMPTTSISLPGPPPSSETSIKSPVTYLFRPPPSPSPSNYPDIKSPPFTSLARPSPTPSPVYTLSRPPSNSSANFFPHHFNSNSNSGDSHEVALIMTTVPVPSPSSSRPASRSGHGPGAFSSVSSNVNPSPSFAKTVFDNPESLKKRSDDIRKKEGAQPNPSRFAAARKEFFDKLNSGQKPEKGKMTMLHFTFYNPPNPENVTKLALAKRKARSRASSMCSDAISVGGSSVTKIEPEVMKNDENAAKANSAPGSIAGSRRTTASSGLSEASASSGDVPGPRVKVGPDGRLIIDEKSIVVETSESQRAQKQIEEMEVVSGAEYAVGSSGFYRYKKNYRRGQDWTERETIRFYRALNQCGTDFSMMCSLFPHRSRQELKAKFKREDRRNPDMISKALASCIFDPDEGISSEEEEGDGGDKEVEEVMAVEGKKKRKKLKVEFSKVQLEEMKKVKEETTGVGTGKGRKWNSRVEGLEGKLEALPPPPPVFFKEIKVEVEKPKKKKERKKKKEVEVQSCPGVVPGTVSIIIKTGVVGEIKEEKEDVVVTATKGKVKEGEGGNKRRSRLPKKPNLGKCGAREKEVSSQPVKPGLCDDLFKLDELEGLPKALPAVVQETDLRGDEEGSEGLVIVDLDELKKLEGESKKIPLKKRRKKEIEEEQEGKVKKVKIIRDPYDKTVIAEAACSSGGILREGAGKEVKGLPYRVPGPGGAIIQPTTTASLADELEIEIEMSPVLTAVTSGASSTIES